MIHAVIEDQNDQTETPRMVVVKEKRDLTVHKGNLFNSEESYRDVNVATGRVSIYHDDNIPAVVSSKTMKIKIDSLVASANISIHEQNMGEPEFGTLN